MLLGFTWASPRTLWFGSGWELRLGHPQGLIDPSGVPDLGQQTDSQFLISRLQNEISKMVLEFTIKIYLVSLIVKD